MNKISESDKRVLNLAKRSTRRSDLPKDPESQAAIRRCELRDHARFETVYGPEPPMPPAPTIEVRVRDLKPGDWVEAESKRPCDARQIDSVERGTTVFGKRHLQVYYRANGFGGIHAEDHRVSVYVGPPPQMPVPDSWEEWRITKLGDLALLEDGSERPPKRKGRTPKGETPAETKIIGAINALLTHKDYPKGMPPTGKQIACEADVSPMAVSRFINRVFKGHTQFEGAWRRGDVGLKLAGYQYVPECHLEFDDARPVSVGYRRGGRTPGSHEDHEG